MNNLYMLMNLTYSYFFVTLLKTRILKKGLKEIESHRKFF